VALEGPAGIGKTRLLAAARAAARDAGFRVLLARPGELEREFPFNVARQLFEPVLAALAPGERAAALAGAAGLAAPLFDDRAAERADRPETPFPLLHGLHWLAANLAAAEPLALVVDDLHWADEPSLRFLAYLARRLDGLAILLVVAARPPEPGTPEPLLEALLADDQATALRPGPLSEEAAAALLEARLGAAPEPRFLAACQRATGGNPFLLAELAGALGAEGVAPADAQAERVADLGPRGVARAVGARLRRLPGSAAALARAVAVLDGAATLPLAARLADLSDAEAEHAAGALADAGLLREDGAAFVHPIVRQAVYRELAPAERARAHERAARLHREEGAPRDRVAAHLLQAAPRGEPWAVDALWAAARAALGRGAPAAAVAHLRRALAEPPPPERRAELLRELGAAEALAHAPEAVEHLEQALGLLQDPRERAEAALELGRTLFGLDRPQEAVAALEAAIAAAAGVDEQLALRVEAELIGAARLHVGLRPLVEERLERLRGRVDGDGPGQRLLLASLAYGSAAVGDNWVRTASLARRALGGGQLLAEVGPESATLTFALNALAIADALDEAVAACDAALEQARARGSALGFALASASRSWTHFRRGALVDAEADARAALAVRREVGWHFATPFALAFLIEALVERGELAEAERTLERARLTGPLPDHMSVIHLLDARGNLHLASGRPREALADLLECGRRHEAWGSLNPGAQWWRSSAALAHCALGEADAARLRADEELALAQRYGAPRAVGIALRVAGLVRADDEGLELLRRSVAVLEDSPARLERARSLAELGAALRRAGRRVEARELLREAVDVAYRCGAGALLHRAQDELVAAGARPRRARLSGPGALTPSERRVAGMAAEGMSNREIAQALFVTEKTVEMHLGNAYRKLSIRSRAQLPRALEVEPAGAAT
jgi:DNA-binding CsgD family transcriptional regulator